MAAVNEPIHAAPPAEYTSKAPASAPTADSRPDSGDRFALAFWIGSMILLVVLILCDLLFTWLQ